jgi:hypothetical protein
MVTTTVYSSVSTALKGSGIEVVGPHSENYSELLKRWSDASEREAVSSFDKFCN